MMSLSHARDPGRTRAGVFRICGLPDRTALAAPSPRATHVQRRLRGDASDVFLPAQGDTDRSIDRPVSDLAVRDLHDNRIDENRRIRTPEAG